MHGQSFSVKSYLIYSAFLVLSLVLSSVGAVIGEGVLYGINMWIAFAFSLALLLFFFFTHGFVKKLAFVLFCFGEGLFLAPLVSYYLAEEPNVLSGALIGTVIVVTVFLVIGLVFKNLEGLGSYLFYGLIAFLITMLMSAFIFPIPGLAYVGLVLFSLYISYDINRFKREVRMYELSVDDILNHVMEQYLNIINVFVDLLDILD